MKKTVTTFSTICLLSACAGFQSTYVVKENSENSPYAPFWTVQSKAHRIDSSAEAARHLYFVGEAQETGQRVCLKKAETNALLKTASIPARKIMTLFTRTPKSGKSSDTVRKRETLEQNILIALPETPVVKEYWERRDYLKEKGAEDNHTAYQCNVVVKIKKSDLIEAIEAYKAKTAKTLSGQDKKIMDKAIDAYIADLRR